MFSNIDGNNRINAIKHYMDRPFDIFPDYLDDLFRLLDMEEDTTNNQMELTAVIKALQYFHETQSIKVFTDSKYVLNGMSLWIENWKKNGWKTANKKPAKNKDLWIELDTALDKHNIIWKWVKGHAGNQYNEIADSLARKFIED